MPPLLLNGLKIVAVILCTAGLMAGLAVYQRRRSPHPEWVRKLMHMGSGLIALSLPWLFSEAWPVIVLALLASGRDVYTEIRAQPAAGAGSGNRRRALYAWGGLVPAGRRDGLLSGG